MNLMLKYVFVSSSQAWAEWPELLENYFTLINTAAASNWPTLGLQFK